MFSIFETISNFFSSLGSAMLLNYINAIFETIYMVSSSLFIGALFGIPLGITLSSTSKKGLIPSGTVNKFLNFTVNITRSIPFVILMIAIIPITRFIIGTSIGTTASIVPLSIAAIPFIARITQSAIDEVSFGLIEAGQSMGASNYQIIYKILIPESMPSITKGLTIACVNLISYSAMAGAIGGGGLGDLAIKYGYQRFDVSVMITTIIILILLVQTVQYSGDKLANKFNKR